MGEVGSGSGAGVAGLDIEKRPDSTRLFGRWGWQYGQAGNDCFRTPG